jgi:ribonuclease BN (tRNA processing enzyme)
MRITFFGTRGSIATPGAGTLRYGGNTSCVEIVSNAGTRVVIDAGTGAVALGRRMAGSGQPVQAHLLISHTHWDHIQGIPFFAPLFLPGNEWDIYGPRGLGQSLCQTLAGQMEYTYFPVTMDLMGAAIRYHDLVEGTFRIGDILVTSRYLNHPALTLGYRLEADGAVVVYACDHEPYAPALAGGQGEIVGEDLRHAEFLAGADLVIHDAQYLASEYDAKKGWGHSTPEYAYALARFAGVRQLALTHHDPTRDDEAIDRLVSDLKAAVAGQGGPQLFAAAEGQSIEVTGKIGKAATPIEPQGAGPVTTALVDRSVLLVPADEKQLAELAEVAAADRFTVFAAAPAEAVSVAARERPSVILISEDSGDPVELCRAIRAISDYGAEVTVVLVTRDTAPSHNAWPFTDRLVAPYSPAYARTRLRAWFMRVAARWVPAPLPEDEVTRLAATRSLGLLDTLPEERFDRITRLASSLFGVPIALITLIDAERQWFKSAYGIDAHETSRDTAFCPHAIYTRAPLIVLDALTDVRFADNPLVQGPPRIRFYAGYPLILDNGACVGTICLIDTRPRELADERLTQLGDLAALTAREFQRGTDSV